MRAFGRRAFGGRGDLGGQALGGRVDLGERAFVGQGDFGGHGFGQQEDLGEGAFGGRALVRGRLAGLSGGAVAIVGAGTWMGVSRVVAAAAAIAHHRTSVACHIRMIGGGIVVAFGGCNISYSCKDVRNISEYFGLFLYIYDGTAGHVMRRYVFPLSTS